MEQSRKGEWRGLGAVVLGFLFIFLPQPVFSLSTAIALPLAVVGILICAWGFSLLKEFYFSGGKQK